MIHHIAADGSSLVPLATDLMTAYSARAAGQEPRFRPLGVQYADFAIWQQTVMGSPDDPASLTGRQLAFWRDHLAGMPALLEIPTDRPRTERRSIAGGEVAFTVPAELQERCTPSPPRPRRPCSWSCTPPSRRCSHGWPAHLTSPSAPRPRGGPRRR